MLKENKLIRKSCCFTGPRPKNFPWKSEDERYIKPLCTRLETEIRRAVENGYQHFISGMAIGVDLYAARIVLKIQAEKPNSNITLEAAIPFPSQPAKWTNAQKSEYFSVLEQADTKTIIGQAPTTENFNKRNDYMIDNSEMLIAVKPNKPSGTQRTLAYAQKENLEIVIIDPMEFFDV